MSTAPQDFRPDDSFYAFTVTRPVSILMVVLAVVVFGAVSYKRLALTLMPSMSYPTLTVRTSYPGTAPEEMENTVARPLEQQLGIIPKLVSISSISKAAQTDIILEFQWKSDMNIVAQDVREKIDRLRLPDGAQRPLLLHYDPSLDPILRVGLAGPQSLYELRHLAENDLKRRLESLPGVAAIQIKGGLEEQFLVALDESKLATLRLDITQIGARLQAGNVNAPGGNLREGQTEYLIRTLNEFRTLEEIGALIVARQGNVDIRLRDIATVTRYHKDRDIITRVNGRESVELEVYKEADANVVSVAQTVREAIFGTPAQQAWVAKLKAPPSAARAATARQAADPAKKQTPAEQRQAAMAEAERARHAAQELITRRQMTDFLSHQLPTGASLELLADQSVFISRSIDEVKSNAFSGAIIAIAILYLFLRNVVQTIIIGLSIPISIVATFAPMYMTGVSLNIISLGGLALGVGMLVDNGIVVLESIFRCREEGDELVTAVVRGTQEVGMAVIASTLTTVAVFFPIVFVEGVAGQLFGDMALTVVFSLLASLATALFLIPMLASRKFGSDAPPGVAAAVTRRAGGEFLQFPARREGESRLAHAWRGLGGAVVRAGWGVVVVVAAVMKAAVTAVAVALWPLVWPIERWRLRRRARAAVAGEATGPSNIAAVSSVEPSLLTPAATWFATFAAWCAADTLGKISSDRVWPGLLVFSAPERIASGLASSWRWLVARRWRWLALLVGPALGVAAWLITRKFLGPAAPGGPPLPPGLSPMMMPGLPGAPARPWYFTPQQWFKVQDWWVIVLVCVPGVLPFVFVVARFATEVALRGAGSVLQTAGLAAAQLLTGLMRAFTAVGGPATEAGLGWFERGYQRVQDAYPRLIAAALRRRVAVIGGSVVAFLLCWFVLVPRLGKELIPQVHQGEFNLDLTLPVGAPIERTAEVAARIDARVMKQPEVERTALTVGADESSTATKEVGEHTAQLTVRLKPGLPATAELTLIDRIRAEFRDLPEVKLEVSYPALFSFRSPIEVEVRGHDLTTLKRLSREVEAVLASRVPGLVDVRSTLQTGHPEIEVVYHRDRLAEYGLSLRSVADLVRNKVQGRAATQFRKEDQMIDIVVRLREEDRFGLEELRRLVVNPGGAVPLPLSAVAELTVNEGPSEIRRVDQQRTALITANVRGADLATVSRDIAAALDTIECPPGFTFAVAGQNREMQTSLDSLLLAFGLALFLVYIVMASQFESLVQPLLIMMTVPLALIGVVVVLWLGGIPLSIMVFLGLIILAGIVVNNAIVLIDYINTLRDRGLELTHAIAEAGRARLRPILMTTLTTVLGLFPMALGLGEGAEIRAPMAITVIVGLSVSTLLTLVVIPTLYYLFPGQRGPTSVESAAQAEAQPTAK
ncbi:MAG: efflux RND transporter permease subunit [Verrucomicrobia bacterium]|nr:efflux RND transporter permease subunit [Verrucomicrobiota bacterium]